MISLYIIRNIEGLYSYSQGRRRHVYIKMYPHARFMKTYPAFKRSISHYFHVGANQIIPSISGSVEI